MCLAQYNFTIPTQHHITTNHYCWNDMSSMNRNSGHPFIFSFNALFHGVLHCKYHKLRLHFCLCVLQPCINNETIKCFYSHTLQLQMKNGGVFIFAIFSNIRKIMDKAWILPFWTQCGFYTCLCALVLQAICIFVF